MKKVSFYSMKHCSHRLRRIEDYYARVVVPALVRLSETKESCAGSHSMVVTRNSSFAMTTWMRLE